MIVSLALHSALVLPLVMPQPEPPDDPPILVVELMGIQAPTQSEEKVQQQTKGEEAPQQAQPPAPETPPTPQEQQPTPAPEEPKEQPTEDGTLQQEPPPQAEQKQDEAPPQQPSPAVPASTGNSGSTNVDGVAEQQKAQTLAAEKMKKTERLRVYLRMLTKRVQENLLYPDAGRKDGLRGTASVAFTVQADGTIAPGTLRVATSSGQPRLDAAAMKTVEASAPFAAPPRVISIAISVVYGKLASGAKKK